MRILLTDAKPYDREFFNRANAAHGFEIVYVEGKLTPETALMATGCETVCSFVNDKIDTTVVEVLAKAGVKLLALRCAGYNNVDFKACFGRIHVVRVPAYSPHAVAEHAVALLMTLNRNLHRAVQRTRDGNFQLNGLLGFDLHGKTAGIVGTGRIGRIAAEILRGIGMRVLCFDPFPDAAWALRSGCEYVQLDQLYRESRVISLHCPLTPENRHMINRETLAVMQDGVVLINTGRGPLIHTADLVEALKKRKVGGAALDVYEEEEHYFFEDFSNEVITDDVLMRLLSFPNVIVTAHQAFFTREALTAIAETTLGSVASFARGDELLEHEICYQCSKGTCLRKLGKACFPLR
jgi:D-lactate dehydrogenase